MSKEQAEILAKLKEIEAQASQLLVELANLSGLHRTRINRIVGLAGYIRTLIGNRLTVH